MRHSPITHQRVLFEGLHPSALRDPGSRRSHSTSRVSTWLITLSLPSFAYWKVALCGRGWFGELFVFNHTVPRSDWEGHVFTSNIGLTTRIQRSSLSGSDCPVGCVADGTSRDA